MSTDMDGDEDLNSDTESSVQCSGGEFEWMSYRLGFTGMITFQRIAYVSVIANGAAAREKSISAGGVAVPATPLLPRRKSVT